MRGIGVAVSSLALATSLALSVPADAQQTQSFKRVSTTPAYANTDINHESVAEISTISPDGTTLYYTDADGHVSVLDTNTNLEVHRIELGGQPDSIDAETFRVIDSWSAGNAVVTDIDTTKDGNITFDGSIDAPREPDAVGWIDNNHVATANEGDWKGGTRNWTIFDLSGNVVWDAGNSLEHEAIRNGHWLDARAEKKGIEPEGLAVATFGDTRYAFVGSERVNVVAVYDVTDPANPVYLQLLPATNGPEGILPIPQRNLLAASSEEGSPGDPMRATVALYELSPGAPVYPQLTSANDADGNPIPWLAMGALSASEQPGILYGSSDLALLPNRIYTIDANQQPALITESSPIVDQAGNPTTYDIEGIWQVNCGDEFWLGVEGNLKDPAAPDATSPKLVQVVAGVVQQEIELPQEVLANLGKWNIEGITGTADQNTLYVAIQRDADKTKPASILEYDRTTGEFKQFFYELESTDIAGDWLGLSEISMIEEKANGAVRLALIERDKQTGPLIQTKAITEVTIEPDTADQTTLTKTLVRDLVPDLQAPKGWAQEKVEGMTIDAVGDVYIVTDNDGLDDINGETVFLNLGKLFGERTPVACDAGEVASPAPPTQPAAGHAPEDVDRPTKLPRTGR